jgi:hypothetical protein
MKGIKYIIQMVKKKRKELSVNLSSAPKKEPNQNKNNDLSI